jgi:hypothetical protein
VRIAANRLDTEGPGLHSAAAGRGRGLGKLATGFVVIAPRLGSSFRTPHSVHLFCKHMPPGRPALVVVSLGLDHKRLYGVGMVQGASSPSGNCLLDSAIGSISSVLFAHPPDLAGALEAKV